MSEAQHLDDGKSNDDNGKSTEHLQSPKQKEENGKTAVTKVAVTVALLSMIITGMHTCIYWDATHVENRAYVGFKEMTPPQGIDSGNVRCEATFVNAGRTPAYNVSNISKIWFDTTGFMDTISRFFYTGGNVIASNVEFPVINFRQLDSLDRVAIRCGTKRLYFNISIGYRDIFGKSHRVHMCSYWSTTAKAYASVYSYAD